MANQYKVLDSAAVTFSERFYQSLAYGASFGEAAREARIALNYQLDGEVIDWAVPVLYTQDPDYRLAPRSSHTGASWRSDRRRADARAEGTTRSEEGKRVRVGVSDLARQFVNLDRALAKLNNAQGLFWFEQVDPTVPLGVWQLTGETRYLLAPEFAKRMKGQFRSLGVEFLLCSTDHIMRAPDAKGVLGDLYSWCSPDPKAPIALFSTSRQNLDQEGPRSGRVAANAIAEGLAGCILGPAIGEYKHASGPQSCPFHESAESRKFINNQLTFHKGCRDKIKKHAPKGIPGERLLDALEKILRSYDTVE